MTTTQTERCGYCHGIGACPECWGRAAHAVAAMLNLASDKEAIRPTVQSVTYTVHAFQEAL